ncbi:MAG: CooT family nickel-binding protein, partial [candidate division NC10 bacterium]|nr:CooT family nickel-binding protein [candidate division NC10 bacterium]
SEDGREDLYLKDVDIVRPEAGKLYLRDIFGEQKVIEAEIQEINLLNHRIVLKKR